LIGGKKHLAPDAINLGTAFFTLAVFDSDFAHLKAPALDDHLPATVTVSIFTGIAGHIAGIDVF
jgi:hypothetical protein